MSDLVPLVPRESIDTLTNSISLEFDNLDTLTKLHDKHSLLSTMTYNGYKEIQNTVISLGCRIPEYSYESFSMPVSQWVKRDIVLESLSESITTIIKKIKLLAKRIFDWIAKKIDDFIFKFNRMEKYLKETFKLFTDASKFFSVPENPTLNKDIALLCIWDRTSHTPKEACERLRFCYEALTNNFRSRFRSLKLLFKGVSDLGDIVNNPSMMSLWVTGLEELMMPVMPNIRTNTLPTGNTLQVNVNADSNTGSTSILSIQFPGSMIIDNVIPVTIVKSLMSAGITPVLNGNPAAIDLNASLVTINDLLNVEFKFGSTADIKGDDPVTTDGLVKGFPLKTAAIAYSELDKLYNELKSARKDIRELKDLARESLSKLDKTDYDSDLDRNILVSGSMFNKGMMLRKTTLKMLNIIHNPFLGATTYTLSAGTMLAKYLYEETKWHIKTLDKSLDQVNSF